MIKNGYVYDETEYRVIGRCCVCGEEILADGTSYYDFDGDDVCYCCKDDYVDEYYKKKAEE